jgi:hypothetical protein
LEHETSLVSRGLAPIKTEKQSPFHFCVSHPGSLNAIAFGSESMLFSTLEHIADKCRRSRGRSRPAFQIPSPARFLAFWLPALPEEFPLRGRRQYFNRLLARRHRLSPTLEDRDALGIDLDKLPSFRATISEQIFQLPVIHAGTDHFIFPDRSRFSAAREEKHKEASG